MYANNRNINRRENAMRPDRLEKALTAAVILTAAGAGGIGIAAFAWPAAQPLVVALGGGL